MRVERKRQKGGDGEQGRGGEEERCDRRADGEELIQSETFEEVRDKSKRNERRGQAEEKEKGPLVVALGRMIAHLTTDAHELNKLSFPFLCQFPQFSSPSQLILSLHQWQKDGRKQSLFFFLKQLMFVILLLRTHKLNRGCD